MQGERNSTFAPAAYIERGIDKAFQIPFDVQPIGVPEKVQRLEIGIPEGLREHQVDLHDERTE